MRSTIRPFRTTHCESAPIGTKVEALESRLVLSADEGSPSSFDPAVPILELEPDRPVCVTGSLTDFADVYSYQLQLNSPGFIRVTQDFEHSIDLIAQIVDEDGTEVAPPQVLSTRPLVVSGNANQLLFLRLSAAGVVGDYGLTIESVTDDVGPDGLDLTLSDDGVFEFLGSIEAPGDTDTFHLQSDSDLELQIALDAVDLGFDPVLNAVNQTTGEQFTSDYFAGLNSQLTLTIPAHQPFTITAAGFTRSTGAYHLRAALLSDIGNTPETAEPLPIIAGTGTINSELRSNTTGFDRDFFNIIAPADGLIRVSVDPLDFVNSLDSLVNVRNQSGEIIAINDDQIPLASSGSLVEFNARRGENYTIEVRPFDIATAVAGGQDGAYSLTVQQFEQSVPDSVGNIFSTARPIWLNDGFAIERVSIDYAADQDMYQFVAPADGTVTVTHRSVDDQIDAYLTIYDDSQEHRTVSRSTVPFVPRFDSDLEFAVERGRTYFIRASVYPSESSEAHGSATGVYGLGVAFRNQSLQTSTFDTAQQSSQIFSGEIDTPGDSDQFLIHASLSGQIHVRAHQTDPGDAGALDWILSAFLIGSEFEHVGFSSSSFGSDLFINLPAEFADQDYLVIVQGNGQSVGGYQLTIDQSRPDDFVDTTVINVGVPISGEIGQYENDNLNGLSFSDYDDFQLNLAPGEVAEIVLERLDQTFSPTVELFGSDYNPHLLGTDALRPFRVQGGEQPIFVRVAGNFDFQSGESSRGRYRLSVGRPVLDGFAETFDTAQVIAGVGEGPVTINNRFDSGTDSDFYSFTAAFTGQLRIREFDHVLTPASGSLFNQVHTYDSLGTLITFEGDIFVSEANSETTLFLDVVQGQQYFIELRNNDSRTGDYRLELNQVETVDDVGANGRELLFTGDVSEFSGAIEVAGDTDEFHLRSATATTLRITLDAADTRLDPVLRVVHQRTGEQIGFNDDSTGLNSQLTVTIPANQAISIIAAGFSTRSGGYNLRVERVERSSSIDDVGEDGLNLVFDELGATGFEGRIDTPYDTDIFRVQTESDTTLSITLDAAASTLDPVLLVIDEATGGQLGFNDDGSGLNSRLILTLAAHQTIRITASGYGPTSGAYKLGVESVRVMDEVGANGQDLSVDAQGNAEFSGSVDFSGDTDVFHLPPGLTGSFIVTLDADSNVALDPLLRVLDGSGFEIDRNDDGGGGLNSSLLITLMETDQRDLVASGFGSTAGRYRLRLRRFEGAAPDEADTIIELVAGQRTEVSGRIDLASDTDVFTFTAVSDGTVVIEENADGDFLLDPLLRVRDASGAEIAFNDDGSSGLNSRVSINVVRDQVYQIVAGAFGSSVGSYRLVLEQRQDQGDVSDTFSPAAPLMLSDESSFFQGGSISERTAGGDADIDIFRLQTTSFTGAVNIRLAAFDTSLSPGLAVFTGNRQGGSVDNLVLVALAESDPLVPNQVSLFADIEADTEYFVRVIGLNGTTGSYFLGGSAAIDAVPSSIVGAVDLPVTATSSTTQVGTIDFPNDRDVFRLTAPKTGRFTVTLRHTEDSALDPVLTVYNALYDSNRNLPVGRNDDGLPGSVDSELTFDAHRDGEVFFLEASGLEDSVGEYEIIVTFANVASETAGVPLDAESVLLSAEAPLQIQGMFESARDVDFFTFVATEDGRVASRLVTPPGSSSGLIRILRGDDNAIRAQGIDALTQVASGDSEVRFDVMAGQRYCIELRDQLLRSATAVPYSLELQFNPRNVQSAFPKDQSVNDTINEAFQTTLAGVSLDAAATAVLDQLKRKFGVGADQRLTQTYFVLLVDPVDFLLTDPTGRSVGFTTNTGTVNETRNAYYSGDGFGELVVLSGIQMGAYQVALSSVAGISLSQSVRFMAIGPDGFVPINATVQSGNLNSEIGKSGVLLALDIGGKPMLPNNSNTTGVFAQLADRVINRQSAGVSNLEQFALASLEPRADLYSPELVELVDLNATTAERRVSARPIFDHLRSMGRVLDDLFGFEIGEKLKNRRLSGRTDADGTGDAQEGPSDLVPVDNFWWHLGRMLIDAPGALMDLMDGVSPPTQQEQKRDEKPKASETKTTHHSHELLLEQQASRLVASHKSQAFRHPFGRNFRKPSPWDNYPEPVDFSWPWATTKLAVEHKGFSRNGQAITKTIAKEPNAPRESEATETASKSTSSSQFGE